MYKTLEHLKWIHIEIVYFYASLLLKLRHFCSVTYLLYDICILRQFYRVTLTLNPFKNPTVTVHIHNQ